MSNERKFVKVNCEHLPFTVPHTLKQEMCEVLYKHEGVLFLINAGNYGKAFAYDESKLPKVSDKLLTEQEAGELYFAHQVVGILPRVIDPDALETIIKMLRELGIPN